jgi:uncharacterized membrane protein
MKYLIIILILASSALAGSAFRWSEWKLKYDSTYGRTIRDLVLVERSIQPVTFSDDRKVILDGMWVCAFSGDTISNPYLLDVITLVPVMEAWKSGGNKWSKIKKRDFSNYLEPSYHLVVVKKSMSYRRKSREPSEWLPSLNKCDYIINWTKIKNAWGLTMDVYEKVKIKALKRKYCR